MRKRFQTVILLAFICFMCGCAYRQEEENSLDESDISIQTQQSAETGGETKENVPNTESSKGAAQNAESEAKDVELPEGLSAKDEIWFLGENANAGFNFAVDEYDYVFYFRGLHLSCDKEKAQIDIDPVEFVWNWETDRWLAWGNSVDDGPYCEYRNEKEEVISLLLTENTEFHMCNFDHDPILSEICDRNQDGWENVTTNPDVFMYYLRTQYSDSMERYPFFMILNEDGTVKYVIEYPLV
ncbi:MAG: hypothetical protein NC251_03320 [Lachnoclostridium sp.]|nr:hypothetical protein [Lachnospira sp.]MCM1247442.1 hypothetical protein [Lachnoclostridium sp.]MCM1536248.1 hypothetical protein [Clostridium sp.]